MELLKFTKHPDNECGPIRTYDELFSTVENPPSWYERTIAIASRSGEVIKNNTFDCHIYKGCGNPFPPRLDATKVPRTIVCHDMKNGYLNDKYVEPVDKGNGYTFSQWRIIDMFIYFSHHFITIPPLGWINLAHKNGVQIMGTLITEWDAGEALCAQFLKDEAEMHKFVQAMVTISVMCNLDGWLINIENKIEPEKVDLLIQFVAELTREMHAQVKNGVVIWYDSVVKTGKLEWQNELNDSNRCFFDVCDGIYLNYNWTTEHLKRTVKVAGERYLDVYAGVDAFGRNPMYPPGTFNGVSSARKNNLSVVIFAPGWTHETLYPFPVETLFKRFVIDDHDYWHMMWGYLYTHPVVEMFHTGFFPGTNRQIYDLQKQELLLAPGQCCSKPFILRDRCCYKVTIKFPCAWQHLVATEISLPEECVFLARTFILEALEYLDLVLIVVRDDEMLTIYCRCAPDEEYDEPLKQNESVISGDIKVGRVKDSEVRYVLRSPPGSILKHIYASSPIPGIAIMTGFTVQAKQ